MTKLDILIAALTEIVDRQVGGLSDEEIDHGDADDALVAYIDNPEVTRLYGSIIKWYA